MWYKDNKHFWLSDFERNPNSIWSKSNIKKKMNKSDVTHKAAALTQAAGLLN